MWIELQSGGVVIESMDALFGLCRKKSAGKSVLKPLSGTLMFADQNAVDELCWIMLAGKLSRAQIP